VLSQPVAVTSSSFVVTDVTRREACDKGKFPVMSELARRVLICKKLRQQELPSVAALRLEGGYGDGWACCGCGERITSSQAEYQVDFAPEVSSASLRFHRLCFQAWQEERQRIPG
jgi:hypothetical protein